MWIQPSTPSGKINIQNLRRFPKVAPEVDSSRSRESGSSVRCFSVSVAFGPVFRRGWVRGAVRYAIHIPPDYPEHREILRTGLDGTAAEVAAKAAVLKPAFPA